MDIYALIVLKIVAAQEAIIGPVAIEQAEQVKGLEIDWPNHQVTIDGGNDSDEAAVIDALVAQYEGLFGQISVEVSKESASVLLAQLPADGLPEALK